VSIAIWRPRLRCWRGGKGYTANLTNQSSESVIDAYHQRWRIEKSFRMSKHDLHARLCRGLGYADDADAGAGQRCVAVLEVGIAVG
jgi:hypothetical protein